MGVVTGICWLIDANGFLAVRGYVQPLNTTMVDMETQGGTGCKASAIGPEHDNPDDLQKDQQQGACKYMKSARQIDGCFRGA